MSTTLVASPRGSRVGFTSAGDGTQQISISVLPKLWRPEGRRSIALLEPSAERHQVLALYELDRVHAPAGEGGTDLSQVLRRCLQPGSSRGGHSLLAPDLTPTEAELLDARTAGGENSAAATDLLLLFDQLELVFLRSEDLLGGPTHSALHRPLLFRRLLDEVSSLANSARRGYRAKVSVGGAIRGQILPASLARYSVTSDPRLACRYDELTESTVLLGIICAALEQIAEAKGLRSPFSGRHSLRELRSDAARLRRIFAEVTALPSARARREGRRLRLARLDQPWFKALQMSLTVLDLNEYGSAYADLRLADAVEISVRTDVLWERIVTAALRRAGFSAVVPQDAQPAAAVSDPWIASAGRLSGTQPDNLALLGEQLWVVDAKYKTPPLDEPPARNDQYQMFAYSHLVNLGGRSVERVALVYPGQGPARVWRRGGDDPASACLLNAFRLPFPDPAEVRSPAAWEGYLDRAGETLRTLVEESTPLSTSQGFSS